MIRLAAGSEPAHRSSASFRSQPTESHRGLTCCDSASERSFMTSRLSSLDDLIADHTSSVNTGGVFDWDLRTGSTMGICASSRPVGDAIVDLGQCASTY